MVINIANNDDEQLMTYKYLSCLSWRYTIVYSIYYTVTIYCQSWWLVSVISGMLSWSPDINTTLLFKA